MSDIIKKIKIKKQDGTFTDYIPIGVEAENVNVDGESVEAKLNKTPYYYNSVADMKADENLKSGDMAITLGYYEANDDGAGEYKIVSGNYIDNGGSYHQLNNNLFAELIINKEINVKQFGAYGDDQHDDTLAIQKCLNWVQPNSTVILTKGIYLCGELVLNNKPIIFTGTTNRGITGNNSTLKLKENYDWLLKLDGSENRIVGMALKNIILNGNEQIGNLLEIVHASFIDVSNVGFNAVNGSAISMADCMESTFNYNLFRRCGNETHGVIHMKPFYTIASTIRNCNNIHIENNTFGYNSGNWILIDDNTNADAIWICRNKIEYDGTPSAYPNANELAVLDLQHTNRTYILDNNFTQFSMANNKYTKIISCSRGFGIYICNNIFHQSDAIGIEVKGNAKAIIKNNWSTNHTVSYNFSSTGRQNIDALYMIESVQGPKMQPNNYHEIHTIWGPNQLSFIFDSNSINKTKTCAEISTSYTPICEFFLSEILSSDNTSNVIVKVRVKSASSTKLRLVNGSNTVQEKTVNSTDWQWIEFNIDLANIDITSFFRFVNTSTNTLYIDGMCFIEQ